MGEFILHIIGWFFIWGAVDYKRTTNGNSVLKHFSREYWIQIILMIIGGLLIGIELK